MIIRLINFFMGCTLTSLTLWLISLLIEYKDFKTVVWLFFVMFCCVLILLIFAFAIQETTNKPDDFEFPKERKPRKK